MPLRHAAISTLSVLFQKRMTKNKYMFASPCVVVLIMIDQSTKSVKGILKLI